MLNDILIEQVEKRSKNLTEIYFEVIDDNKCFDQIELVKDSFEVSDELIKCIENDQKYTDKWFNKLKSALIRSIKEGKTIEEIKQIYNRYPKCFTDYLLDNLDSKITVIDTETSEETNDTENEIDDDLENNIENFSWRMHQTKAIENTELQGYVCGIHHQIMGAGKSYIMLNIIHKHYNTYKKNSIYLVVCDRQEVLKKMFFDGTILDKEKIKFWKKYNIIDFNKFNIIDCVNYKPNDIKYDTNKPNILIINNDYLQSKKGKIKWNKVALMEVDECHCVSGNNFYELLKTVKYTHKVPIIGFSATPLRDRADDKVKDIFSTCMDLDKKPSTKKVNIISHYDLMMAISDEIVLPFTCEYVEIKKTKEGNIGTQNKQITQRMFTNIVPKLPYKKFIMWCRRKEHMMGYYIFFKNLFGHKYDIYCTSSFDQEMIGKGFNTDLDAFYKKKNNAILLCINKCREGSDIKNVDCGMFLDGVKKRSTLVSMQTGGRIMRPDDNKRKTRAFLIDTFVCDGTQTTELFTVNKVIAYYKKLLNLAEDYDDYDTYYNDMLKVASQTIVDEKSETITIKIDENTKHDIKLKIKLLTKKIDWNILKQLIKAEVDNKFKVDKTTRFKQIITKLKELKIFDVNCLDFWKTYNNISKETKDKHFLPNNFYDEYKEFFDKSTWYELLNLDTSHWYQTKTKCIEELQKLNIYDKITAKIYYKICKIDIRMPINPAEFFKKDIFTNIENEFNVKQKVDEMFI